MSQSYHEDMAMKGLLRTHIEMEIICTSGVWDSTVKRKWNQHTWRSCHAQSPHPVLPQVRKQWCLCRSTLFSLIENVKVTPILVFCSEQCQRASLAVSTCTCLWRPAHDTSKTGKNRADTMLGTPQVFGMASAYEDQKCFECWERSFGSRTIIKVWR